MDQLTSTNHSMTLDEGVSTNCYLEEYLNPKGVLTMRLREKVTGRKVGLRGSSSAADKRHFIRFMNAAGVSRSRVPAVFSKDCEQDCIVISGDVDIDSADELMFIHNDNITYMFA